MWFAEPRPASPLHFIPWSHSTHGLAQVLPLSFLIFFSTFSEKDNLHHTIQYWTTVCPTVSFYFTYLIKIPQEEELIHSPHTDNHLLLLLCIHWRKYSFKVFSRAHCYQALGSGCAGMLLRDKVLCHNGEHISCAHNRRQSCCGRRYRPLVTHSLNQAMGLHYCISLLILPSVQYGITVPLYRRADGCMKELSHTEWEYKFWWIWDSSVLFIVIILDINFE